MVDEATNTVTATIPVGGSAPDILSGALAVDPFSDTVYLANSFGVSVADGATAPATISVGGGAGAVGAAQRHHLVARLCSEWRRWAVGPV